MFTAEQIAAMQPGELEAALSRLQAENQALRNATTKTAGKPSLTGRVSDKGAMSVYGIGRFPVTLYRNQWLELLAHATALTEFLNVNAGAFSTGKGEPYVKPAQVPEIKLARKS